MAEEKTTTTPVYVSYLTFANLLDWLRELKTIPTQFDRSFWGERYSGSTGVQLMSGLRFLGLLEENRPQERLEQIALASNEDRKPLIVQLLRDAYGNAIVDGLARMTPAMLNKAMQDLGTTDGTHRKAISFFVNAAKAIDLPMPTNIAKQARNKASTSRARSRSRSKNVPDGGESEPTLEAPTPPPAPRLPEAIHAALVPILSDLPQIAPSWDAATRERWHTTFKAVLDYAYPVDEGKAD
jgi:hypothetical protein